MEKTMDFKLISADGHINEPPAAWERVQKEYGDRAPKVVRDPEGFKGIWVITDGLPPSPCSNYSIGHVVSKPGGLASVEMDKHYERIHFHENFKYEDFPASWEPAARIKDQDTDGVAAEVLFASVGRFFYGLTDGAFQRAIFRSYNAWLGEFCSYDSTRLVGVPLISIIEPEKAAQDIREYAKLGFKAAQIPYAIKDSGYHDPAYEPIWKAADETGVVLHIHLGGPAQGAKPRWFGFQRLTAEGSSDFFGAQRIATATGFLSHLMFSGVFDRHPNLKVVCTEYDVGWVAIMYEQANYRYGRATAYGSDVKLKMSPGDYMRKHVWFTFQDDRAGMLTTPVFGEDNFMWASDYPHGNTTWPYSQRTMERIADGVSPGVKRKVGRENANKLYRLGL
jgi:uncharacterized protein